MTTTRWILPAFALAVSAAFAGDIAVRVVGQGVEDKTITLTTNLMRLVYTNWDSAGETAGGWYELRAYSGGSSVVLIEESLSAGGVVMHEIENTRIGTNLIPRTLRFGSRSMLLLTLPPKTNPIPHTTVTVFRVEGNSDK
jgi:hypothetical protein